MLQGWHILWLGLRCRGQVLVHVFSRMLPLMSGVGHGPGVNRQMVQVLSVIMVLRCFASAGLQPAAGQTVIWHSRMLHITNLLAWAPSHSSADDNQLLNSWLYTRQLRMITPSDRDEMQQNIAHVQRCVMHVWCDRYLGRLQPDCCGWPSHCSMYCSMHSCLQGMSDMCSHYAKQVKVNQVYQAYVLGFELCDMHGSKVPSCTLMGHHDTLSLWCCCPYIPLIWARAAVLSHMTDQHEVTSCAHQPAGSHHLVVLNQVWVRVWGWVIPPWVCVWPIIVGKLQVQACWQMPIITPQI